VTSNDRDPDARSEAFVDERPGMVQTGEFAAADPDVAPIPVVGRPNILADRRSSI
jgi:hypothetical protein